MEDYIFSNDILREISISDYVHKHKTSEETPPQHIHYFAKYTHTVHVIQTLPLKLCLLFH